MAVAPALDTPLEHRIERTPFADDQERLAGEKYRRKFAAMNYRLDCNLEVIEQRLLGYVQRSRGHPYVDAREFHCDLVLVRDSLLGHGDRELADGDLKDLLRLSKSFGFHLAALDVRQESTRHTEAVAELLATCDVSDAYATLDEEAKLTLLSQLIHGEIACAIPRTELSESTSEVVELFFNIAELRSEVATERIGQYVISMTHEASHILEVTWIASLAGLCRCLRRLTTCSVLNGAEARIW